ncbi:VanZ family protein [uncultured Formosa sp.]|uniref:VanZ family protein n=1 Tax=uncultured Formosa sp. TaxID=255435 RepID=UPI002628ED42|nr:VanZ family protein [uncultured Formosa sp.]
MLKKRILIPAAFLYTFALAIVSLVNLNNITEGSPENSDKVFHFLAYSLLALIWYIVFNYGYKWSQTKALFSSGLLSISFGVLIEYLQGNFTETRQFDVLDILANSAGVVVMLLIVVIKNKFEHK